MLPPEMITPVYYTNWTRFLLAKTSRGLSIEPRPTPRLAIAMHTTVIAIVFIGFAVLTYYKSVFPGALVAVLVIGIPTTVGVPLATVLIFRHQQRLGPVMIFDLKEKTIDLPRHSKKFKIEEVDSFCVVTAKEGDGWRSQLQLHSVEGGRFLLAPAWTRRELNPMLDAIISEIPVQVCSYTEDRKAPDNWRAETLHQI